MKGDKGLPSAGAQVTKITTIRTAHPTGSIVEGRVVPMLHAGCWRDPIGNSLAFRHRRKRPMLPCYTSKLLARPQFTATPLHFQSASTALSLKFGCSVFSTTVIGSPVHCKRWSSTSVKLRRRLHSALGLTPKRVCWHVQPCAFDVVGLRCL